MKTNVGLEIKLRYVFYFVWPSLVGSNSGPDVGVGVGVGVRVG